MPGTLEGHLYGADCMNVSVNSGTRVKLPSFNVMKYTLFREQCGLYHQYNLIPAGMMMDEV